MKSKFVYIIREDKKLETKSEASVRKLTSLYHDIRELSLEQAVDIDLTTAIMIIVDVAPIDYDTVTTLKIILKEPKNKSIPFLFIISKMERKQIIQTHILGAIDYLSHPINADNFTSKLEAIANDSIEKSWQSLSKTQEAALKVSLKVFEDTFSNIRDGKNLSNEDMRESCDLIIKATAEEGLASMISAIRTHHNYTYRHSMMVSGYLTSFGLLIGISGEELQNLTTCGLLHDIGKAKISPYLLNKPGALNDEEWVEMKKHPEHSKEILEKSDCHDDVKDGSYHHHEKLDGSGYPHGLSGSQISDIARMVAISDIFSGLTEKRSYKESMSNKKAYEIMLSMENHLDMDLLGAFKPVALNLN